MKHATSIQPHNKTLKEQNLKKSKNKNFKQCQVEKGKEEQKKACMGDSKEDKINQVHQEKNHKKKKSTYYWQYYIGWQDNYQNMKI